MACAGGGPRLAGLLALMVLTTLAGAVSAQEVGKAEVGLTAPAPVPAGEAPAGSVPVTIDTFVRAATDAEIAKYIPIAGGVNRFHHARQPTPVDAQPTIRMNRDTLYSTAVIDISQGATLTLPDAGSRYMSAMVVNQDHYINEIFHGAGTYRLDMTRFDTPYVVVVVRTLVDANDPVDIALVNALQDKMTIQAGAARDFEMPAYDPESFREVQDAALDLARHQTSSRRTFGSRQQVDPVRHFLGTAFGWGGLPETEAFYLNVEPRLPVGEYKLEVPASVPVGAFWSVSLYNPAGFFEPNPLDAYSVNSVNGQRNPDGSLTVHFGGCDDGRANCLPIMEGWNYAVRLYRPGAEILNDHWTFPSVQPM